MLQLAKNTSSSAPPDARQQPYSAPQSTERGPDGLLLHAPQTQLSEDDLMHEELRRHYPVPKSLNEVEKQALTFHVVRLEEIMVDADQLCKGGVGEGGAGECGVGNEF